MDKCPESSVKLDQVGWVEDVFLLSFVSAMYERVLDLNLNVDSINQVLPSMTSQILNLILVRQRFVDLLAYVDLCVETVVPL